MSRTNKPIRSDIAWSTADRISVRGLDLPADILGKVSLGDMAFLELTSRLPTRAESIMFNALAVTLVEHGITPSSLVARLTYLGAPESLQAAVAAGLCGLGSTFVGSMEGAARLLQEALENQPADTSLEVVAARVVEEQRSRGAIIPGIGHNIHRNGDPRTPRLFQLATEHGFSGRYVKLMELIAEKSAASGRKLPINATGAIAAIASEMGLAWNIVRGIGVMARAIGLVGHILEETRAPLAAEVWHRTEAEASEHARPK